MINRTQVDALLAAARKNAIKQGHKMSKWRVGQFGKNWIAYANCEKCWESMSLDTRKSLDMPVMEKCEPKEIMF